MGGVGKCTHTHINTLTYLHSHEQINTHSRTCSSLHICTFHIYTQIFTYTHMLPDASTYMFTYIYAHFFLIYIHYSLTLVYTCSLTLYSITHSHTHTYKTVISEVMPVLTICLRSQKECGPGYSHFGLI